MPLLLLSSVFFQHIFLNSLFVILVTAPVIGDGFIYLDFSSDVVLGIKLANIIDARNDNVVCLSFSLHHSGLYIIHDYKRRVLGDRY